MKYIYILLMFFMASSQTYAVTAQALVKELDNIIKTCKKVGFYKCETQYFQGDTRGIFHLPIEKQKLKLTEEKYDHFLKNHFDEGFSISFFKKNVDIKFNLEDKFDTSQFSPANIQNPIQPLNKENTLFKVSFKAAPPVVLVALKDTYKIGILPEQEMDYRKSNEYKSAYLYKLKNNILEYHMKEAEMLKYDKSTLEKKVSEAQAPILIKLEKGIVSDIVKKMSNRTMKDIQRFYIPLDSEKKIIAKIKMENKL